MFDFSAHWYSDSLQIHVQYEGSPLWAPVCSCYISLSTALQSNDLTETEKKLAREYLKEETKKLEDYDVAMEVDGDTPGAEENQEEAVYIPGAGRLSKLNNRDLRRLNKEGEFNTRFVAL